MDRFNTVQTQQRDMKYNFEREFEMIQDYISETKDKMSELNKRIYIVENQENTGLFKGFA